MIEFCCVVKCFDVYWCVVGGEVYICGVQFVWGQCFDCVVGLLVVKVVFVGFGLMGGVVDYELCVLVWEVGMFIVVSGGVVELEDFDEVVW